MLPVIATKLERPFRSTPTRSAPSTTPGILSNKPTDLLLVFLFLIYRVLDVHLIAGSGIWIWNICGDPNLCIVFSLLCFVVAEKMWDQI